MPTKYLLIRGRVQGVYYRASAKDMARKNGLTGWIRNTPDGHVEAVASGTEEQLELFINWGHREQGLQTWKFGWLMRPNLMHSE